MRVMVRGGGDLASGVVLRMRRSGWQVLVVELAQPRAVRRTVSFAQAIYDNETRVEDVQARRVTTQKDIEKVLAEGLVPVVVDPQAVLRHTFAPQVIVDGRMRKQPSELERNSIPLVIGLGPGFIAGKDCHAVVETNRGPFLGRVYWEGPAQADTGIPEQVGGYQSERVLRAPQAGIFTAEAKIGQRLVAGEIVAQVDSEPILAPFNGILRGLIQTGLNVWSGEKIGDVDPRGDTNLCWIVSDKSLAVGGGVLEAILTWRVRNDER